MTTSAPFSFRRSTSKWDRLRSEVYLHGQHLGWVSPLGDGYWVAHAGGRTVTQFASSRRDAAVAIVEVLAARLVSA